MTFPCDCQGGVEDDSASRSREPYCATYRQGVETFSLLVCDEKLLASPCCFNHRRRGQ